MIFVARGIARRWSNVAIGAVYETPFKLPAESVATLFQLTECSRRRVSQPNDGNRLRFDSGLAVVANAIGKDGHQTLDLRGA